MADEYKSLAEATAFALVRGGTAVMDNPQKLLSYLADTMDPDSMEMRVLMRCCDEQLVEPYRQALGNGLDALRGAEARARDHLINECMIEPRTAARVSEGIASGIAARYGLRPSVPQRPAAQPQPVPQTQAPVVTPTSANYTHTAVVTPPSGSSQSGGTKAPAPQAPAQPQPQPVPQPQPQPTPTPVVQQTTQQPDPGPKKKSPLPIVAAVVALVVAAVIVLPRLFGGAGSSMRGGVFPSASEDEGVWLVTDSVTVNASGETVGESHNTYDEHGNLLSSSSYTLEDDGTTYESSTTFGSYDEYGYPSSSSGSYKDEWSDGSDYESNASDSYTNEVDEFGRITGRSMYSFTESGVDYSYSRDSHYTYSYVGNVITAMNWEATSDSSTESGYSKYDEYGNQLEYYSESTYDDGDFTSSESVSDYVLASDGTPISETYRYAYVSFDGETRESHSEWEFDEHGTVTKSVYTDFEGKTTTTEYKNEYDSNGNLTKRTNITENEVTTYTRIYISDPSFAVKNNISAIIRYR